MSNNYRDKIADLICSVARREDAELLKISNKGIFACPELAFVYSFAKALSMMSHQIFEFKEQRETLKWSLEKSDNKMNIRRLDLYIVEPKLPDSSESFIAIEFKLGYEVTEWEEDVIKLIKIKDKKDENGNISHRISCRIFCAMILVPLETEFKDIQDIKRIKDFLNAAKNPRKSPSEEYELKQIGDFDLFRTRHKNEDKQCIIGTWEVTPKN